MGKLTISMAMFNSYVQLPEGSSYPAVFFPRTQTPAVRWRWTLSETRIVLGKSAMLHGCFSYTNAPPSLVMILLWINLRWHLHFCTYTLCETTSQSLWFLSVFERMWWATNQKTYLAPRWGLWTWIDWDLSSIGFGKIIVQMGIQFQSPSKLVVVLDNNHENK